MVLKKANLVKIKGAKLTSLRLQSYDGRVAGMRDMYLTPILVNPR